MTTTQQPAEDTDLINALHGYDLDTVKDIFEWCLDVQDGTVPTGAAPLTVAAIMITAIEEFHGRALADNARTVQFEDLRPGDVIDSHAHLGPVVAVLDDPGFEDAVWVLFGDDEPGLYARIDRWVTRTAAADV